MPPEERNSGKFKAELRKSWPGFALLGLIIIFFMYATIQDGKGGDGIKSLNAFSKKNNNAAVLNINDSASKEDLVSLVYSETNGYSENVQKGVISLVLNRVSSNDFPNNIHDVIYQANQFESVYSGTIVPYASIPEDAAKAIEQVIEEAKAGDNTGGALFYYKPYQVTPPADAEIRQMQGVKVIDDVVFMTTFPY